MREHPSARAMAAGVFSIARRPIFDPTTFKDRYEETVVEMLKGKEIGRPAYLSRFSRSHRTSSISWTRCDGRLSKRM
jgi:hypothetical protein